MNQLEPKGFATIILATIIATAIITGTATYVVMQRQKEQITLNITIIPQELYPLNLEGWIFKLQFGVSETYIAQKDTLQYQDSTLYGLLKKIHGTS